MFDTTYYCDSQCPHCHYSCGTKSKNFMPEEDVYTILTDLEKYNSLIQSVNFSGGEATALETKQPGYIKRVLSKSLQHNFYTILMTNGSFVQKPYAGRLLNDLGRIYLSANNGFAIQMSFDQYHKNCIPNAHELINRLDKKLENQQGTKYDLYLMGFKHDPNFKDNFKATPKNITVHNNLAWDLNPLGRAKENKLPNCRDTGREFQEWCNGDKLKQLVFTPLYPISDQEFCRMLIFDCNGYVRLSDAHNPENYNKFKTSYKKPDGTIKTLPEIDSELTDKLIAHFYGTER